ncbi:MAG TPA: HD domain-containing phosphohydrolase [Chloroflexota bacterium]|nr:HD domain-containing phosphohydrolase [Chloroflexota bacterium]
MTPTDGLLNVPLFRRLRPEQLVAVAEAASVAWRQPGDVLVKQDETGQALYVLLEGAGQGAASSRLTPGERRSSSLSAGDYVGELAILEPAPSTWTITITQRSRVLVLTQVQLAELMRRDPELAIAIARGAGRLARTASAPGEDREMKRLRAQMLLYAGDLKRVYDEERIRSAELREALMDTIRVLINAIESKDPRQVGHGGRVARYAQALAQQIGWDEDRCVQAAIGGLVHDIGHVGLRDAIVRKRGPLDREELAELRQHPEIGARLLRGIKSLEPLLPYVLHHHEHFDGNGYPEHRRAQEIPIEARLVAVADAFDDIRAQLPPHDPAAAEAAIQDLRRLAADRLDPDLVLAFVQAYRAGLVP